MTSKEAIQRLKDDIEIGYLSTKHDNVKDKENYLVMLKSIEKDLEMLRTIKKYYRIDTYIVSLENFISIYIYKNDEDFNKVKEWLENDR